MGDLKCNYSTVTCHELLAREMKPPVNTFTVHEFHIYLVFYHVWDKDQIVSWNVVEMCL